MWSTWTGNESKFQGTFYLRKVSCSWENWWKKVFQNQSCLLMFLIANLALVWTRIMAWLCSTKGREHWQLHFISFIEIGNILFWAKRKEYFSGKLSLSLTHGYMRLCPFPLFTEKAADSKRWHTEFWLLDGKNQNISHRQLISWTFLNLETISGKGRLAYCPQAPLVLGNKLCAIAFKNHRHMLQK